MIVHSGARSARRARFLGAAFPPFSKPLLKLVTAASLAGLAAAPAIAGSQLPTGGTVASGNVTIGTPANNSLTVTQTSSKAIVNWQGFSIGSANTVTFNNGSGATLNRVTGAQQSNIDGTLNATGSVYLLNPNGVVIGQSGVVNVGRNFVASTLGASDAQFNASGPLTLNGNSQAAVVNLGKIGSLGGDVALVAQQTLNAGTISAPKGSAGVLTGTQVTLRDSTLDDGKFNVDVGNSTNQAVNKGNISAAEAELKANGGNVYALAGNTSGVIAATGVSQNDGKVFLTAGDTGTVTANTVIAAQTSSGAGGTVETSGGKVDFTGIRVHAGDWLIDPYNLDVEASDAATISTNLATTDVTLKTTATGASGPGIVQGPGLPGDVTINAGISWNSDHSFTVSAYRSVIVDGDIASSGGGNVTLRADNSGTGTGNVVFQSGKTVSTSGAVDIFYNPAGYDSPTDYSGNVGGGATLTAYMLVNTPLELQLEIGLDTTTLGGTYALNNDLDMDTGIDFIPIGTDANPFTGLLDGQGHTISNLTISLPTTDEVGLFTFARGTIRNLTLDNSSITGKFEVGSLAGIFGGWADNVTVTSSVTVTGGTMVGGIVGDLASGFPTDPMLISNSRSAAQVNDSGLHIPDSNYGGVAGQNVGTIINTSSSATLTVDANDSHIGGLVGINGKTITNDTSTATIVAGTAALEIGGLVGFQTINGTITGSSADVDMELGATQLQAVGGLVGENQGTIEQSSVTGTVKTEQAAKYIGGLVGQNDSTGQIINSQSMADVTSTTDVGGLVGWNNGGTISESNAGGCGCSGSVTGITNTGGLVGLNSGQIEYSTATLPVFGTATLDFPVASVTGGLVGLNDTSGHITQSTASGAVDGDRIIGGLAGSNAGAIDNSTSSSIVTSAGDSTNTGDDVGGLVGTNQLGGTITLSSASGDATGSTGAQNIGGLVGLNEGAVLNSGSTTEVSGDFSTGGLVGTNGATGTVTGSWAIAVVFGGDDAGGLAGVNAGSITGSWSGTSVHGASTEAGTGTGGLVGTNDSLATITYSYAVGNVASTAGPAGGLIGNNLGSADNVYASGKISGTPSVAGGLVGDNTGGTLSNAYWDTATTTEANPVGVSGTETNVNSVSTSDNSAYTQASYTNFDFTAGTGHWFMIDGQTRPFLQAEAWSIGADQYLITNAHQLQLIAMAPNADYQLTGSDADIDANATSQTAFGGAGNMWTTAGFVPIASFGGTFEGRGGAIDSLYIGRPSTDDVGLFAQIAVSGVVSNLGLTNVFIGGQNDVGALAGLNYGKIYGDYASGGTSINAALTGVNNVGGLVGTNEDGGLITQIGVGPLGVPIPTQSFVSVSATGDNVGDLAGLNVSGGTISDSFSDGSLVNGNNNVGGLVGQDNGAISNSFSSAPVLAFTQNAGGLVGLSIQGTGPDAPTITASYATGTVDAPIDAGGLIGDADQATILEKSYASGAVTGTQATGGLIGLAAGATISDVYALGSVTQSDLASSGAGGLIGFALLSTVDSGYASGAVSSPGSLTGGLIGESLTTTATNLFWDEDTTGQSTPGADFSGTATQVGFNTTGLDAYNSASYAGLNADGNWLFVDGILGGEGTRPMLAAEYSTVITNAHQLQLIATQPNAAYVLGNNFDALATSPAFGPDVWSPEGFSPIFTFGGTLEGNGFQIDALSINRPTTNSQGIFDMIAQGAQVSDLALVDFSITGQDRVAALAGTNFGTVVNMAVASGIITGRNYVGGLVGANRGGGVVGGVAASVVPFIGTNGGNIVEFVQIFGNDRVGGIVGYNAGSVGGGSTTNPQEMSVSEAFVNGADQVGGVVGWNDGKVDGVIGANLDVEGTGYGTGGIIGYNTQSGSLSNAHVIALAAPTEVGITLGTGGIGGAVGVNGGAVSNVLVQDNEVGNFSSSTVGGLVGSNLAGGTITNSSVDNGDVAGTSNVGGFAGANAGTITGSTASASVLGSSYVGGFSGSNLAGGVLNFDSSDIDVEADGDRVGGFVGWNAGSIGQSSSAQGDVSGNNQTGGFVGWNDGSIDTSSSLVDTVGSTGYATGGFAGYSTSTGSITHSLVTASGAGTVGCGCETGAVGGFIGDNKGTISGDQVLGIDVNDPSVSTVGGFAGKNEAGATIDTSTVDSSSSVEGYTSTGGFVGNNGGSVHASESDAAVQGASYVGGFAGSAQAGGSLKDDTATGAVTATGNYAGGFAGANGGSSIDSTATGNVIGAGFTGGFVGWNKSSGSLVGSGASGTVSGTSDVGGLVGTNDGSIDNASVTLSDVEGSGYAIGGLVGYNSATGSLTGSTVSGAGAATIGMLGGGIGGGIGDNAGTATDDTVNGLAIGTSTQTTIGGFVGKNESGSSTSYDTVDNTTTVHGLNFVGGFVGANLGDLEHSTSGAAVTGTNKVGGFAGSNALNAKLVSDTATGAVTGTGSRTGGLVGWNAGTISSSLANGSVHGFDQTGGLVGWNDGSVDGSAATGEVTGDDYAAGGLIGYATATSVLTSVSATGTVDGTAGAEGGLIGYNQGSVTNAYALGSVGIATTHTAGGLIGNNYGALTNVFAAGPVNGSATVGALVGVNEASGTITNGYYDTLVTGALTSIKTNYNPAGTHVHALTVARPPDQASSYTGFDFINDWTIQPAQMPTLVNHP